VEDLPPLDEFTALLEGEAALQLFDKAPLQPEKPNEMLSETEESSETSEPVAAAE
jgi:hypothetical protein